MSAPGHEIIWVSWEAHRRTRSIVNEMGIPLFEFASSRHRLVKHPEFIMRTWALVARVRPRTLIIQSPSIVLNILAVFLKAVYRFVLVVDAHNAGVYSCEKGSDGFKWLYPLLHRRADLTIVTNEILAETVRGNGGSPRILIDPLPDLVAPADRRVSADEVTFICTFAQDEPFREVFAAAGLLPPGVVVNVTGNAAANRHLIGDDLPANVRLTGFLPEAEFVALLASSAAVIDLTTWNDCLVCGGYEAMAVGTPLIVSDSPVNRDTFRYGTLYCDNSATGIAAAVTTALVENDRLRADARAGMPELMAKFRQQLVALELDSS